MGRLMSASQSPRCCTACFSCLAVPLLGRWRPVLERTDCYKPFPFIAIILVINCALRGTLKQSCWYPRANCHCMTSTRSCVQQTVPPEVLLHQNLTICYCPAAADGYLNWTVLPQCVHVRNLPRHCLAPFDLQECIAATLMAKEFA